MHIILLLLLLTGNLFAGELDDVAISTKQAKALYDRGVIFIDVSRTADYERGNIKHSISLSFITGELGILYSGKIINYTVPIVVYCTSGELSNLAEISAMYLAKWGYENVFYYKAGYYDWLAHDYPVELNNYKNIGEHIDVQRNRF
jgi:rhodanese-related sulfurtransferase